MADRHEYGEKLKTKIDNWNGELDVLEKKLKEVPGELQTRLDGAIKDFKVKYQETKQRIQEMETDGEGALQEVGKGVEDAWEALKQGFKKAKIELDKPFDEDER